MDLEPAVWFLWQ